MKCPYCKEDLVESKKDQEYLLCYPCKKKFKKPGTKREEEIKKEVEKKAEEAVSQKKVEQDSGEFPEFMEEEESRFPGWPMLVVGIAIIGVAAAIVYMLL